MYNTFYSSSNTKYTVFTNTERSCETQCGGKTPPHIDLSRVNMARGQAVLKASSTWAANEPVGSGELKKAGEK